MSETVFHKVDYTLASILGDIELGQIGLPDMKGGSVWTNSKVRDLVDSMYRGYPVGYILFWQAAANGGPHVERFYMPSLSSTTELKGSDAQHYLSDRF